MGNCRQGEENCGEKSGGRNVDQMGRSLEKKGCEFNYNCAH